MTIQHYEKISTELLNPLPGATAQEALAIVSKDRFVKAPNDAKQAAVAVMLYPGDDQELHLLLVQRSVHAKDKHSGQISFPGGSAEPQDASLLITAMRESLEEIDVQLDESLMLGALSSMYIPVSNFVVQPYVFGLPNKPQVLRQEAEVAEVFGYSIDRLLRSEIRYRPMKHRLGFLPSVPYYDLDGRMLWGATGMMTQELLHVLRAVH